MRKIPISLVPVITIAALLTGSTAAGADEQLEAEKAFALFAGHWMKDLSEDAARERARGFLFGTEALSYRTAAPEDFVLRTQATGKPAAPYVGILTYTEEIWECSDASRESCKVIDSSPVTEIFPYKDGAWRH
jgi:hypothetical protein